MRRDKKSRGALLRFVVLEGIGRPVRLEGPDEAWLRDAFERHLRADGSRALVRLPGWRWSAGMVVVPRQHLRRST